MKNCYYCGIKTTPTITKKGVIPPATMLTRDHVIPKALGGRAGVTVDACLGCNQDKGKLTIDEYRVVIAFRNGLVAKPDVLFNAEKIENLMGGD